MHSVHKAVPQDGAMSTYPNAILHRLLHGQVLH